MGILSVLGIACAVAVWWMLASASPNNDELELMAALFVTLPIWLLTLVWAMIAIVLGICGLRHTGRRRTFCYLGISLAAPSVAFTLWVWIRAFGLISGG